MTPAPRTPLTLEFHPEVKPLDEKGNEYTGIVVCEPSFDEPGAVFCGVNPLGGRLGCTLKPHEAARLRDHLAKLLMEPPQVDDEQVDWQARIQAAADRAQASLAKRKRGKWLVFRFEFQVGDIQGVIGRLRDDR